MIPPEHRYMTPWANRGILVPYLHEWCLGGIMPIWLQMFNYVNIPGWITTGEEIKSSKVQSMFNFLTTVFEVEFRLGVIFPNDYYKGLPSSDPNLWANLFGSSGSIGSSFKEWTRHMFDKMMDLMDDIEADGHFSAFGVGQGADTCVRCPSEGYSPCNDPPLTQHCGDDNHATFREWIIRLNMHHLGKIYKLDPDSSKTDFTSHLLSM